MARGPTKGVKALRERFSYEKISCETVEGAQQTIKSLQAFSKFIDGKGLHDDEADQLEYQSLAGKSLDIGAKLFLIELQGTRSLLPEGKL